MKKMTESEMRNLNGGKKKKCGGCGKTYYTWVTYTYHWMKSTKGFVNCLPYISGHTW